MSSNLSSSYSQFNLVMSKANGHSIYEFDRFRLDRDRKMLYRGETEIALPPKAVETLSILVENHGEIVSKDELIDAVWSDSVVEESNLSHYLYLIRKALGDSADGKPFIETLRRRGYRFTAEVRRRQQLRLHSPAHADPNRPAERRAVERRGNVLTLKGWNDPETKLTDDIRGVSGNQPAVERRWPLAIGSIAILLVVGLSTAFYFSLSSVANEESEGTEQRVTQLTNGIEVHSATISPDGKHFVYHEPDGKLHRIWLQQTGHTARNEIVTASERVPLAMTFTPDSQYVYLLASEVIGETGNLYRVPTLGGPLTRIRSGVQTGVSFSPDGGEMVYFRQDADGARYVIGKSDGSGEERMLLQSTPGFGSAAWSPDGKWIGVVMQAKEEDHSGGCRVAVVKVDTFSLIEFSKEIWATCGRMEWSPDGRGLYMIGTRAGEVMTPRRDQLFFVSYPQGRSRKVTSEGNRHQWASLGVTKDGGVLVVPYNRSSQIWGMDPGGDSRSAGPLTHGQADGRGGIAPLADGRVAYISRTGERLNVWKMNSDGSDQRQITDDSNAIEEIRSGGDGRYLVFSGYSGSAKPHLFRLNNDGSDLRQLTSGNTQEVDSSLSHDGKWIVYDSVTFHPDRTELSIWKQPIEGGERVSLGRNDCQMPHFSPDDRFISCVRAQKDILILSSADGSLVRELRVPTVVTLQNSINFGARWTPDGRSVAYIVNENGISNIWTHPIDGGPPKRLTDFTHGSIYHFAYAMDGKRLFLARGNQVRDAILIKEGRQ